MSGRVRALAGASHPLPTLAVTVVAVLLAAGVGLDAAHVVLIGAAVVTGQLSIGWSNDSIDAARDLRSGRADKPVATGAVAPRVVAAFAGGALVTTVALSALLGPPAALAALTLVVAGWAYNLGLKSTALSGLPYLIGFAALPAVPYLARAGHPGPPWWAPVAGGLLGFGAHFANVLPDLGDDLATGVRGLPHRLGARRGAFVMASALGAASIVIGVGSRFPAGLVVAAFVVGIGGAIVAAVAAWRRPDSSLAFQVAIGIAVLDVSLILAAAF